MTITILAILFLAALLLIAFIGTRVILKKTHQQQTDPRERCSLCRESFNPHELVLRQVGDYKLLYFCRSCILKLMEEIGGKK
jgi:hypothetical protein